MNVLDHISLGVPAIDKAREFYDVVLAPLGIKCLAANQSFAAYGVDAVQFLIMVPSDGREFSRGNGTHIAFRAGSVMAVDTFHAVATGSGGKCAGAPGPRPDYPASNVYAAFAIDPFGHKLEAIHNGFAA